MKKLILFIAFIGIAGFANAQCNAAFTYTINGGDTVIFNDISTYDTNSLVLHTWTFGNGGFEQLFSPPSSPNPSPQVYYANKYIVCLTISSDTSIYTCSSSFCDTITIINGPHYPCNATFNIWMDTSWNNTYPTSNKVYFSSNLPSLYGAKWFWSFGDGSYDSTGIIAPTHQYASPGIYNVCLTTVTNMGDTCSYCNTINTFPCYQSLNASFTQSISGNTVTFTSSCSGSSNSNPWYWTFGDGYTANTQNPVHSYLYNGTYTVCLTYYKNDSTGCSKIYCDTITITSATPLPCNALFSYSPDTMSSNIYHFYSQSTLDIVSWNWSFPGGTPSSSTSSYVYVTYPSPGTYIAYLTVTNQSGISCSDTEIVYSGINCSNTNAYFTMSTTATPHVWSVVNMAIGASPISYSWNWGDGSPNSTGATPTHTYSQPGFYNICLTITDANGCGSSYCTHDSLYRLNPDATMISVIVTSSTLGMNNLSFLDGISIYPNPANDIITIENSSFMKDQLISVYDVRGQLLSQQPMLQPKTNIDISTFAKGLYYIKLKTEKGIAVKKFVKE